MRFLALFVTFLVAGAFVLSMTRRANVQLHHCSRWTFALALLGSLVGILLGLPALSMLALVAVPLAVDVFLALILPARHLKPRCATPGEYAWAIGIGVVWYMVLLSLWAWVHKLSMEHGYAVDWW